MMFRHRETLYRYDRYHPWPERLSVISEWITQVDAEVVALQEVDRDAYKDLVATLHAYDSVYQEPSDPAQPCGVATFWKKSLVKMAHKIKSRALCVEFNAFCVINVHLESAQTKEGAERRARQLHSALTWTEKHCLHKPLLLGGDFNTGADSALHKVLREHKWHGYSLASVYEHPDTRTTLPASLATYASYGRRYMVDHVWYSWDRFRLVEAVDALDASERKSSFPAGLTHNIPDDLVPSDHVFVAAGFYMTPAMDVPHVSKPIPSLDRQRELCARYNALRNKVPRWHEPKPPPPEIRAALQAQRAEIKEWMMTLDQHEQEFLRQNPCKSFESMIEKPGVTPTHG